MERTKLDEILANHKKWLEGREGGEKADLRGIDLRGADLRGIDLKGRDLKNSCLRNSCLRYAELSETDLSNLDLSGADLRGANLRNADLRNSDLTGANLDYSCFPLWYGGSSFKCSERIVLQLLAHISTLEYESNIITKEHKALFLELGKHSHIAKDLELIEE